MTNDDVLKVCAILTCNGIEHTRTDKEVIVKRESICNKISGENDLDSVDQLIEILNTSFQGHFVITRMTYDGIMLDRFE